MFRNYLTTALRNLTRNKSYTIINILGLALGMGCCLVVFLLLRYELSFDQYHTQADYIYRINTDSQYEGKLTGSPGTPMPVINALRTDFPQLKATALYSSQGMLVTVPGTKAGAEPARFQEERKTVAFAEPEFFDLFDYQWVEGNARTALHNPNSIVLTEELARKYFGAGNALGKIVKLSNKVDVKVTGIIKDPPANTDFPFRMFISYNSMKDFDIISNLDDWVSVNSGAQVYIRLPLQTSPRQFEQQLAIFNKKYRTETDARRDQFSLQPLADIHFNEEYGNYNGRTISKQVIYAIALAGLFLLVTACINFVNLATAQAIKRSKEVGVRKVLGSSQTQLLWQFMGETACLTSVAMLMAVFLAILALPFLNELLNMNLQLEPFADPFILLFLVILTGVVTVLAGFYPALVLSGYKPVQALKGKITYANAGNFTMRKGLVVVQFAISQLLIIGTVTIYSQLDYFQSAPMGFDTEAILTVPLPQNEEGQLEVLQHTLQQHPGIRNVSYSFVTPASGGNWSTEFKFDNATADAPFQVVMRPADTAYFNTFGLQLVAGRKYYHSDTIREFVVNETLVEKLGLQNPEEILGKTLSLNGSTAPVVGVVKDFHTYSLHAKSGPAVLTPFRAIYFTASIKLASQANSVKGTQEVIKHIEEAWKTVYPEHVFSYEFLDERIANFYKNETRLAQFFRIFACIAIFICCLGLYGLVSFMAIQKTKEIGIRKVLGASVSNIVWLFSKEFMRLIALAFLIAAPIGFYTMTEWLQNFDYAIGLGPQIFMGALVVSVVIAWITVGYRAIQSALSNPVKALRSE